MNSSSPLPTRPAADAPCPCGSGRPFGECCAPVLADSRRAETAEQLMRSRFTAHVLRDFEHLHRTYLETARRPFVAEPDVPQATWTRLVIHAHEPGVKPNTAMVDFSAFYREGDVERALDEKSEFVRIDGTWFYARSVREGPPPVKVAPKPGRNEPCPCGSGKKYKHCCGR